MRETNVSTVQNLDIREFCAKSSRLWGLWIILLQPRGLRFQLNFKVCRPFWFLRLLQATRKHLLQVSCKRPPFWTQCNSTCVVKGQGQTASRFSCHVTAKVLLLHFQALKYGFSSVKVLHFQVWKGGFSSVKVQSSDKFYVTCDNSSDKRNQVFCAFGLL